MKVQQNFNPPLKVKHKGEVVSIPTRNWTIGEANETLDHIENMGDMGLRQIEEVWKHYQDEIYVSNYGYVAKISEEEAQNIFGEEFNKFQTEQGVAFRKLNDDQKNLIRRSNFVPKNKENSGCEIWLQVGGEDLHKMVAEKFLQKPEGKNNIHHIDNNSYNNSITNLVYLDNSEHTRAVHPMSYKN